MYKSLLILNPPKKVIEKVDITSGVVQSLINDVKDFPDGIVVSPDKKLIYWTNMGFPKFPKDHPPVSDADLDFYDSTGYIEEAKIDGTGRRVIVPPGKFITGKQLTADWHAGRLYWCDREGCSILSVKCDGTDLRHEVIVADTDAARHIVRNQCVGIAIDTKNGHLYWTQKGPSNGGDGRIFRTHLEMPSGQDPAKRTDIEVLWEGLPEPIDIEIDPELGFLYWTDRGDPPKGNTLNRAHIPKKGDSGESPEIVAGGFHEAIGLAVDKLAGIAYVGDLSGVVRAVDLAGGSSKTVVKLDGGFTGICGV